MKKKKKKFERIYSAKHHHKYLFANAYTKMVETFGQTELKIYHNNSAACADVSYCRELEINETK